MDAYQVKPYRYDDPSLHDVQLANVVKKRLSKLKEERAQWEQTWRDLGEHILPRRLRWISKPGYRNNKLYGSIVDGTATLAFRTLASGMMMGITSPSRIWFRYVTQDRDLMEDGSVKKWLSVVQNRQMQVLQASNIYRVLHTCYEDLGVFGTAVAMILRDFDDVIRGYNVPIGLFWLATGPDGAVDTLYRMIPMTVGQVAAEYGYENLCETSRNAYDLGDYHKEVNVYQCIEPNRTRDPHRKDFAGKVYRSIYWEEGSPLGKFLAKRGYDYKPFIAPRWSPTGLDAYGHSPAMEALGDIRQLQFMQKKVSAAVDRGVDPPLQGPSSIGDPKNMSLPGRYTAMSDADLQRGGIRTLYDVNLSIGEAEAKIAQIQDRINATSYADLFMMMSRMAGVQPRNEMEIAERRSEKMLGLGPVLERLQDEMVEPVVDLSFDAMQDAEILPPPPPPLAEAELSIELQSMLAREQRGDEIIAMDRVIGITGNISAVKPDIVDKVDFDQAIDEYGRLLGAPPSIVVSDRDVEATRSARARKAEQAEALEAANQGAQAAKTLSEADTESSNALAAIVGSQSGQGVR